MMQTQPEQVNSRPIESFPHHKDLVRQFLNIQNKLHILVPKENDLRRTLSFIEDNDKMSDLLFKEGSVLENIKIEKDLKGSCKLGVVICIDGRISILHKFGKTANTWEIAGSQIEVVKKKGKYYVNSDRLIGALKDNVEESLEEKRDLLEIITAHTDKKGKCAKIRGFMLEHNIVDGDPDTVALKEAEIRREAIENTYNDILEFKGQKKLDQVAITAMISTDDMGFHLNYGTESELSTTKILIEKGLKDYLESKIAPINDIGKFGSMKDTFTDINSFSEYSTKVANITKYLLKREIYNRNSFMEEVEKYIDIHFNKLTSSQKKALQFTIARSIANQYVTGLAVSEDAEPIKHLYSEHQEKFLVIAPAGKPFGRHILNSPSFGSTPKDRIDTLAQTIIKLDVMDKHKNENDGPYILFVSTPIKREIWELNREATFRQAIDANLKHYKHCLKDSRIRKKLSDGNLIIIPLLTDEENGRVLEILDNSIFVNSIEPQKI